MSSGWQQLIAGIVAAVVPVLVKFANDWLDTQKKTEPIIQPETPAS